MDNRIKELTKVSIAIFCERVGMGEEEFMKMTVDHLRNSFRENALNRAKDSNGFINKNLFFEIQQEINEIEKLDFWGWLKHTSNSHKSGFLDMLETVLKDFSLNKVHFKELMSKDVSEEISFDDIIIYLKSIPEVFLYGSEFNATIRKSSFLDGKPLIAYFVTLEGSISRFLETVLEVFFIYDNEGFNYKNHDELKIDSKSSVIKNRLLNYLNLIKGETIYYTSNNDFRYHRLGVEIFAYVELLCRYFINFHEYAHLIFGHFNVGPCHEVEFHADYFAMYGISKMKEINLGGDNSKMGMHEIAIASIFFIFMLVELFDSEENNTVTHPNASDRLIMCLKQITEELNIAAGGVFHFYNSLVIIFKPVIQEQYDITINEITKDNF